MREPGGSLRKGPPTFHSEACIVYSAWPPHPWLPLIKLNVWRHCSDIDCGWLVGWAREAEGGSRGRRKVVDEGGVLREYRSETTRQNRGGGGAGMANYGATRTAAHLKRDKTELPVHTKVPVTRKTVRVQLWWRGIWRNFDSNPRDPSSGSI